MNQTKDRVTDWWCDTQNHQRVIEAHKRQKRDSKWAIPVFLGGRGEERRAEERAGKSYNNGVPMNTCLDLNHTAKSPNRHHRNTKSKGNK